MQCDFQSPRGPFSIKQYLTVLQTERFASELWIPAHMLPHEAKAFVFEQFERAVEAELKLLVVRCEEGRA